MSTGIESYIRTVRSALDSTFETDYGIEYFGQIAAAVPDRVWQRYTDLSILLMEYKRVVYAGLVLFIIYTLSGPETIDFGLEDVLIAEYVFDVLGGLSILPAPLLALTVVGISSICLMYFLVLILLPGVVLHELAHAIEAEKSGHPVEGYAVKTFALYPYQAQVNLMFFPRFTTRAQYKRVYAVGPAANFVLGFVLLVIVFFLALAFDVAPTMESGNIVGTVSAILFLSGILQMLLWASSSHTLDPRTDGWMYKKVSKS